MLKIPKKLKRPRKKKGEEFGKLAIPDLWEKDKIKTLQQKATK